MDRDNEFLTTAELAGEVRSPEATVRYWRHIGYGPKSIKVGRRVLYRRADVQSWLDSLGASTGAT